MTKLIESLNSLLEHKGGKIRISGAILAICVVVFLLSWIVTFGIGTAAGIAIGVSLTLISLVFGLMSGGAVIVTYIDWIDNG